MAFIVSLIADAIKADLEAAFSADDLAGSDLVRLGRLMDDPEGYENPICVHENDPDNPDAWLHEQVQSPSSQNRALNPFQSPWFEVGGSEVWVRRFTIELHIYLTREGLEREEAKAVIDTVHGRAIHALRNSARIPGLIDEYGEQVWMSRCGVAKSRMILAGGPPTNWIGRGKIWFQAFTHVP
ncbi:MAG: hypothetical protein GWN58_27655 [Anaerolineae bacterium]|nr:hypothetical protein [Anaerolineae bacterium]